MALREAVVSGLATALVQVEGSMAGVALRAVRESMKEVESGLVVVVMVAMEDQQEAVLVLEVVWAAEVVKTGAMALVMGAVWIAATEDQLEAVLPEVVVSGLATALVREVGWMAALILPHMF
jgi:putative Mn2+ efflux pump MntP